jgi:hypothetical protein
MIHGWKHANNFSPLFNMKFELLYKLCEIYCEIFYSKIYIFSCIIYTKNSILLFKIFLHIPYLLKFLKYYTILYFRT